MYTANLNGHALFFIMVTQFNNTIASLQQDYIVDEECQWGPTLSLFLERVDAVDAVDAVPNANVEPWPFTISGNRQHDFKLFKADAKKFVNICS
jgi:hypothetical protein